MKIRKKEQSFGILGKIINSMSQSKNDTYSCDYINNLESGDALPIGTIVDYDGDTVPDGYEEISDYSTDEIKIGTWIDGKPIYRKVVEYRFGEKDTENVMAYIPDLKRFIKIEGYWVDANTIYDIHQSFDGEEIFLYASASAHEVYERHNFNYATGKYSFVIIDYTKTTD